MEKINIAIDGYSSCGKSTLAKQLAKELEYIYVDSGAMYRAITLYCMNKGIIKDGALRTSDIVKVLDDIRIDFTHNPDKGISETLLNGENVEKEIRTMEVSRNVSPISTVKEVREKLVERQKEMGEDKGVVMDGRDIGTEVFPNAQLKIFMTADVDVRAKRRYEELKAKGHDVSMKDVRENLAQRDHSDTTREESPLRKADDAVVLDNTFLNEEEQLAQALEWAKERINAVSQPG